MPLCKLYRLLDYMRLFVTDCEYVSVCIVLVCVCVCPCLSVFTLMCTMQLCSVYKCIMEAASLGKSWRLLRCSLTLNMAT